MNRAAADITVRTVARPAEWRTLMRQSTQAGYENSWAYACTLAAKRLARPRFVVAEKGGQPLAAAAARIRDLIPGILRIAYVAQGPVRFPACPTEVDEQRSIARALFDGLLEARGGALWIAPVSVNSVDPGIHPESFGALGTVYREVGTYQTIVLNLSQSLLDIRTGFKQKWRNQLNAAERKGLSLVMDESKDAIERFLPLYDAITERKGFLSELGATFFAKVQHTADSEDQFTCFIARHEGVDVAGIVVWLNSSVATYVLGASSEAALPLKAGYLLQWRAICEAVRRGCQWYDLGGIDSNANPGVTHFKSGMGGVSVQRPRRIQISTSSLANRVLESAESVLRRIR